MEPPDDDVASPSPPRPRRPGRDPAPEPERSFLVSAVRFIVMGLAILIGIAVVLMLALYAVCMTGGGLMHF